MERHGEKNLKEGKRFQPFGLLTFLGSLVQCDVCGGKAFFYICQPTIGCEKQAETD